VAHGGADDVRRHVQSAKHKDHKGARASAGAITNFYLATPKPVPDDSKALLITKAETTMCELIVHHNLPLAAADSLSSAFRSMFPDSDIARGKQF